MVNKNKRDMWKWKWKFHFSINSSIPAKKPFLVISSLRIHILHSHFLCNFWSKNHTLIHSSSSDPKMATMTSLIGLINKIQRACTVLGDHGGGGLSLWEALPSVAVVGGQVSLFSITFFSISIVISCVLDLEYDWFFGMCVYLWKMKTRVQGNRRC